jgi:nucleotide-binding universal stress UspA family protein
MPIRTIFVPLSDAAGAAGTLGTAFVLAKSFNAHVDTLHLRSDPTESISDFVGETVSPALVEEVLESAEQRSGVIAKRTRKAFDDAVAKARVDLVSRASAQGKATAAYQEQTGLADYWVETRGRVSDLIVVKRPRTSADVIARSIAESALMGTGRPVLLAPTSAPRKLGENLAIAWNGSIEASKAVAAALPFLMRAKNVTAISVVDGGGDHNLDGLVQYLRWHGVRAKANAVNSRGSDVGKAVASAASRAKADMLVMGAYTHSRVREMIFGGVTDYVFSSGKMPVLFAH